MAIWYPGLRFLPTDEELFFDYLMRRLNQEPLPDPDAIRDCDLYGGGEPWKIFDKDRDEKFYIFTLLKKKDKSRVDRTVGSGTWKGEQNYKIKDLHGDVVGYKKLFTFEPKGGSSTKADKAKNGHWIMYEYSKHPHNVDTECVLCVISNKYAEEGSKKVCRSPHGGVRLEEANPRAKKARPSPHDHTNAVDVPSATSPPSSTDAAQAQPSASPAFDQDELAIPQNDICYTTGFPAWYGDGNASLLPPGAANMEEDTHPATPLAFGGVCAAGPLPMTSTATSIDYGEWADRLANVENAGPLPMTSPATSIDYGEWVDQLANMEGDTHLGDPLAFDGTNASPLPVTSMTTSIGEWADRLANVENAGPLPMTSTATSIDYGEWVDQLANIEGDTPLGDPLAFDGTNASPLPMTSMTTSIDYGEWADRLANMEGVGDTQTGAPLAFGGTNASLLPMTSTATSDDYREWLDGLANMEEDTHPGAPLAFGSTNAGSFPMTSTATSIDYGEWADGLVNMEEDTHPGAPLAFGSTNAGSFPMTSTATSIDYGEWADQLKKTEISPKAKSLFCTVFKQRVRALHASNGLRGGVPAT